MKRLLTFVLRIFCAYWHMLKVSVIYSNSSLFVPERCDIPLGSEDSRLPDVAFTVSSIYNAAYQGRLNAMRSGYLFVTSCEQLLLPCNRRAFCMRMRESAERQ